MYNSEDRISDKNTSELSFNQKINRTFTVGEILTSPLWYIKNTEGNVVTAIPLFNCDRIESFNDSDIVIDDNKAIIITVDDEDIPIDCISDDTGDINYYDVHHFYVYYVFAGRELGDPTVFCAVYDECGAPIPNALIDVKIDGEYSDTVTTNNEGLCRALLPEGWQSIVFNWHGFANTRSSRHRSEILRRSDVDGENNR